MCARSTSRGGARSPQPFELPTQGLPPKPVEQSPLGPSPGTRLGSSSDLRPSPGRVAFDVSPRERRALVADSSGGGHSAEVARDDDEAHGGDAHEQHAAHGAHGHGHDPPTFLSKLTSGLVCGLIFFVFCCVFSSMIFGQNPTMEVALTIGVGVHTMSMVTGSLASAQMSSCRAMMAGPDINPAVFMAEAATVITSSLCSDDTASSCTALARTQLVPTVMASIWIASLLIGLGFLALGKFRLTRVAGFIPANVTAGFLSCIGYKVLKASVDVACHTPLKWKGYYLTKVARRWRLLLPGLPIGVTLYLLKRWHNRYPAFYWPALVLIPPALFYVVVALLGRDVHLNAEGGPAGTPRPRNGTVLDAWRDANWLFPAASAQPFWSQGAELYGGLAEGLVDWGSIAACVPLWLVMVPLVCLDNLLQLASTETALQVDLEYATEMYVGGVASVANALLAGAPVYGLTKFNAINYGLSRTIDSPLPTLICGAFCGVLFFSGFPVWAYLPRFELAGLLIFAGLGFVIENLWDARKVYNRWDFASIWAVFLTNAIVGEFSPAFALLVALVVGCVLSAFGFAFKFARMATLAQPISGDYIVSSAIRSAPQEMKLGVLGCWFCVFPVQGYVFFGTASSLYTLFREHIAELSMLPPCERTKLIIVDMTEATGIDATATAVFSKVRASPRLASPPLASPPLASPRLASPPLASPRLLTSPPLASPLPCSQVRRLARVSSIELVWAGLSPKIRRRLDKVGSLEGSRVFDDLDTAVKHAEDTMLAHVHGLAQRWLIDPTARAIYNKTLLHDAISSHATQEAQIGPSHLARWAQKVREPEHEQRLSKQRRERRLREQRTAQPKPTRQPSRRSLPTGPWHSQVRMPKGGVIFSEGDEDDALYLLYLGRVQVRAPACCARRAPPVSFASPTVSGPPPVTSATRLPSHPPPASVTSTPRLPSAIWTSRHLRRCTRRPTGRSARRAPSTLGPSSTSTRSTPQRGRSPSTRRSPPSTPSCCASRRLGGRRWHGRSPRSRSSSSRPPSASRICGSRASATRTSSPAPPRAWAPPRATHSLAAAAAATRSRCDPGRPAAAASTSAPPSAGGTSSARARRSRGSRRCSMACSTAGPSTGAAARAAAAAMAAAAAATAATTEATTTRATTEASTRPSALHGTICSTLAPAGPLTAAPRATGGRRRVGESRDRRPPRMSTASARARGRAATPVGPPRCSGRTSASTAAA